MPPSRLDGFYRKLLITKFFNKGWGKPENLQRLFEFRKIISNRESCIKLVPQDYPVHIIKEEKTSECTILEGKFISPLELHMPGLVPKAAKEAHFQVMLPNAWKQQSTHKPMCIHLAGTGDHYYWRRRNFIAKPLLREANLGAIILENPFYGVRKPESQIRSNLHNVSDIFVMGGCLILESLVLLQWCERNGFGPLGITGLSMGGHMASLAATNWPKPLVLVPCLSWSTAAAVFTQGVMSQSINWDILETQYFSDGKFRERLAKMVTVIDDAFMAGQHFVKNFNQSMNKLQQDLQEIENFDSTSDSNCHQLADSRKLISLDNTNHAIQVPQTIHEKLMSTDSHRLTTKEINLLNQTLKNAQNSQMDQEKRELLEDPTKITAETLLMTDNNNQNRTMSSSGNELAVIPANEQTETSTLTRLMSYILPKQSSTALTTMPQHVRIDTTKTKWWESEALQFMRGVMDECTHLKNFTVPYDTSLIIAVCATDDAYVPRDGCSSLEDVWPGAEVRYLDAGHVSAYVLHQKLFRSCIIEAFERAKQKNEENLINHLPEIVPPYSTLSFEELHQRSQQ